MAVNADGFGTSEYWNKAFQEGGQFQEPFDWLASWPELQEEICSLWPKDARLLVPGCGNAPFQLDMYDAGFENLVCGDSSPVVIEQMRTASETSHRGIQWDLMDATHMPYQSSSLEGVIDKSLIDCLHCCDGAAQILRGYLDEVFRVLVPGGTFMAISCHTKSSMKAVLKGRAWQISKVDLMPLSGREDSARNSTVTVSVCIKGTSPAPLPVTRGTSGKRDGRRRNSRGALTDCRERKCHHDAFAGSCHEAKLHRLDDMRQDC